MAQKKKIENLTPPKSDSLLNNLLGFSDKIINFKTSKKVYIVVLVIGLLILGFYKKDWFVAATINGTPVTSLELFAKMNQQFRSQTINQIVNEKLILGEASKQHIVITTGDIDKKMKDLEEQVGGMDTFDSLLSQQGQTRESLKEQLRLQLIIEKLYESEATVSAQEVDQFIKTNSALLTSTDSAKQRVEAEDALRQQKISQIFSQKFQEIRKNSDVKIF
jgi:hypothetical protein